MLPHDLNCKPRKHLGALSHPQPAKVPHPVHPGKTWLAKVGGGKRKLPEDGGQPMSLDGGVLEKISAHKACSFATHYFLTLFRIC